jgi:hypothetical protein
MIVLHHLRQRLATVLVTAVVALGFTTSFGAAPASATADGCQPWFGGWGSDSGNLCHVIVGAGTHITYEEADFNAVGNKCNWRIDFAFRNMAGTWYYRDYGGTNYSCTRHGARDTYHNWYAQHGIGCAILVANGKEVVRQCHSI